MKPIDEIKLMADVRLIKRSVEEIHAMLNILVQKKIAKTKQSEPIKTKEERAEDFKEHCFMEFSRDISSGTISDFVSYWTESSENSKKLRFEREKVFDIKRRMATWLRNNKKIMPSSNSKTQASGFTVMN